MKREEKVFFHFNEVLKHNATLPPRGEGGLLSYSHIKMIVMLIFSLRGRNCCFCPHLVVLMTAERKLFLHKRIA